MPQPYGRLCASLFLLILAGCGSTPKTTTSSSGGGSSPTPPPPAVTTTTATLSATSYDFGSDLVNNPLSKTVVTVSNTGTIALSMKPSVNGAGFSLVPTGSCGTQLAAGASCPILVSYDPTTPSAPAQQSATLNLNFGDAVAGTASTVALTGTAGALSAGTVTATSNPLVAQYTITPPFAGTVTVNFGTTQQYGLQTWSQPTPSGGGPVSIYVAGMRASTVYHMQAAVQFQNGLTAADIDHTYTTGVANLGTPPVPFTPQITTTTTSGLQPQAGIELINAVPSGGPTQGLYATDASGNVIWNYQFPDLQSYNFIQGMKQTTDGHFVMVIGANTEDLLTGPIPANTTIAVREIDLVGNIVKQITLPQLNVAMTAAGFNIDLLDLHHDVQVLPNGHWLVLAATSKSFTNLTGISGTTNVIGDVVVDLDTNLNPVWVWNEFDHLDVNRHPMSFPDWTHSNAILYSSDDGNMIVSIRHQNWLVKVNYANGTGDGSVLWRLGEGGDFTLQGGTDPTDWFYAQHGPSFVGTSNAGIFSLAIMDNGNDRQFPAGVTCGAAGAPACLYSTVPIMQINESAKTATLTFHQIVPTNLYNSFGGNAEQLQNGNVEYDLCGELNGTNSDIFEVTQNDNPQTVFHLHSAGTYLYRAYRIPSLYPGVQW